MSCINDTETYLDVDFSIVTPCAGCEACDDEIAAAVEAAISEDMLAEHLEAVPLWVGMAVQDVPPDEKVAA